MPDRRARQPLLCSYCGDVADSLRDDRLCCIDCFRALETGRPPPLERITSEREQHGHRRPKHWGNDD